MSLYGKEFLLIKCSGNDFTTLVKQACSLLIPFLEDTNEHISLVSVDHIKWFLASTVARLSAIEHQFYIAKYKNTLEDYNVYVQQTTMYIINNLELVYGIDNMISFLNENCYRKEAINDFHFHDSYNLKTYLNSDDKNFVLLPYLYWCNQESLILRIQHSDGHSDLKSQICII